MSLYVDWQQRSLDLIIDQSMWIMLQYMYQCHVILHTKFNLFNISNYVCLVGAKVSSGDTF